MADEKLVSWLRTLGVTAFDSSNTATETPSNARAQQGVDSAKVSAPTASGSSTSDLIKTKSAEPPPKGGFSAEGKRGMDISTEEGSATGSAEGKIAANDGRGGKSELGGKASAKIDKSGNIDLSLGANQTDLDEKGKGTARSGQATFKRDAEKGQTVVGLSGQQTTSDAEGNEKKVSGGISTSGVQGGYTRTEHIGESFGKSLSGTGAVDWNNKEASASIERKQQIAGDKARSMGADVKGKLGQDGGAEGTLGVSAGRGDWKTGASITLQSVWTVTKEATGQFLVEYIGGVKGSVTTSGQKGKETKGAISGSASAGHQAFFQRHFDTEAEARDFCKKNTFPPDSGADVDPSKLRAGDKTGTMDSIGIGVGGTANIEGVQLGATLNLGTSAVVEITKMPDKKPTVEVKYFNLDQIAAGGSIGAGGISMGADISKQKFDYQVVRFKLDSPEGVAAFNSFRQNGKLQGKGWEVVSQGQGTNDKLQKSIGLFSGKIKMSNSTSSSEETDAAGNKIRTETGTEEVDAEFKPFGDEIKLPGGVSLNTKWLSDWHKEKHSLNVRVVNDQPTFVLNSTVDSKGARGTGRVLANITNSPDAAVMETGASAGAWSGEMPVSVPDMQKFSDRVLAGDGEKYGLVALGASGLDDLKALKSALKKADKQGEAWFQALTEFFSKTGDRGIRFLEVLIGKQKMEISLDPAADKEHAWLRIEDFENLARRLTAIEKNVTAGKVDESTRVELAEIKAGLRKKGDLVTNDRRYTEVPQNVKKDYAEKLKKILVRFQGLQPQVDKALDQKKALTAEAQEQIMQGQKLFAALESAFNGVDKWKTFAKNTLVYVNQKTDGQFMTRFSTIKPAIAEADNALANFAGERELSERGLAELKANPCKEAFTNLSGAVEDGRKQLKTAFADYRKAFEGLQSLRDFSWSEFQKIGKANITFALEDFPKSPPVLPPADFAFIQNGTLK